MPRQARHTLATSCRGASLTHVAEVFAAHLGIPAVSVTPEQTGEYVGFLGGFWGLDGPASAQLQQGRAG